ncbi:MAG: hypothetical protein V4721_12440 [Bacteroidota bacterium]
MKRTTKRRRSSGRRKSRRGRVGAITLPKQDEVMTGLGAIGGLVAVAMINDRFSKMTTPPDPKLIAFAEIVVGFVGPKMLGRSNPLLTGVGYGMIGAAGLNLAKDFGMISGMPIVSGYSQVKAINGISDTMQQYIPAGGASTRPTVRQVITGVMNSQYGNGYE